MDRVDDGRKPVAGVLTADSAGEVEELRPSTSVTRAPSARATTSLGVETPALTYRAALGENRSCESCSVVCMRASMHHRRASVITQRVAMGAIAAQCAEAIESAPTPARPDAEPHHAPRVAPGPGAVCHTTRIASV